MNLETLSAPIPGVIASLCAVAELSRFYTTREVAEILKVSTDTVLRKFSVVPGVIDLGIPENGKKRQYRTLRIPHEVLERFIVENRVA